MATIDDHHRENGRQRDGDPMTPFTVEGTERVRAAAAQALRILERTGLAPITAALLRAALEPPEDQASQTHRTLVSARAVSLTEDARCPT